MLFVSTNTKPSRPAGTSAFVWTSSLKLMSLEAAAAIGIEPIPAIFPFESGADFVTGAGEVLVAVPSPSVVADSALSGGVVPATGSSEPHPDVIRRHVENLSLIHI